MSNSEFYASFKEVQEGGVFRANWYLSHGYVLLDIQNVSQARKFPEENRIPGQQFYVGRNLVYVVGRPDGVAPVDPPPLRSNVSDNKKAPERLNDPLLGETVRGV